MSDTPPPPPRSGCLTAFMIVFGIILLLPGLCTIIFGVATVTSSSLDRLGPAVMALMILGLLIGFAGVMLIRAAIRGRAQ